jgi:hypothetical protein
MVVPFLEEYGCAWGKQPKLKTPARWWYFACQLACVLTGVRSADLVKEHVSLLAMYTCPFGG